MRRAFAGEQESGAWEAMWGLGLHESSRALGKAAGAAMFHICSGRARGNDQLGFQSFNAPDHPSDVTRRVAHHTKGRSMPEIKFTVTGTTKWLEGIVEDRERLKPLTFNGSPSKATENVASGALAWVSIYFWGDPGTAISLEIAKGDTVLTKRNYKIDPDGSAARAVQFDPDE
jgi:hypothetical protein